MYLAQHWTLLSLLVWVTWLHDWLLAHHLRMILLPLTRYTWAQCSWYWWNPRFNLNRTLFILEKWLSLAHIWLSQTYWSREEWLLRAGLTWTHLSQILTRKHLFHLGWRHRHICCSLTSCRSFILGSAGNRLLLLWSGHTTLGVETGCHYVFAYFGDRMLGLHLLLGRGVSVFHGASFGCGCCFELFFLGLGCFLGFEGCLFAICCQHWAIKCFKLSPAPWLRIHILNQILQALIFLLRLGFLNLLMILKVIIKYNCILHNTYVTNA